MYYRPYIWYVLWTIKRISKIKIKMDAVLCQFFFFICGKTTLSSHTKRGRISQHPLLSGKTRQSVNVNLRVCVAQWRAVSQTRPVLRLSRLEAASRPVCSLVYSPNRPPGTALDDGGQPWMINTGPSEPVIIVDVLTPPPNGGGGGWGREGGVWKENYGQSSLYNSEDVCLGSFVTAIK